MLTKATICLAAALVLVVQLSHAWDYKPCDNFHGKLISLKVENCPDQTGEYCALKEGETLRWTIEYESGKDYTTAQTGFRNHALTSTHNHCMKDPSFCPGQKGKRYSYSFEIEVQLGTRNEVVPLKVLTHNSEYSIPQNDDLIVCAEFPAKYV